MLPISSADLDRRPPQRHLPASSPRDLATTRVFELPGAVLTRSLLLVEDDADFAATVQDFLEGRDFRVVSVRTGAEAVKQVLAADFDFILCDMVMPQFPGEMFYRAVERLKPHLCRRFIFMTGHRGDRSIDQFVRSVRGLMLWKPFEFYLLLQATEVIEAKRVELQR